MDNRLKIIRKSLELKQEEMAEILGISRVQVTRLETGKRGLSMDKASEYADKLTEYSMSLDDKNKRKQITQIEFFVDPYEAIGLPEKDKKNLIKTKPLSEVTIIGDVQAGTWREAIQWHEDDSFTLHMSIKPHYEGKAFGLVVRGESMNELYKDGDVLAVVKPWDYQGVIDGKRVVVERRRHDLTEATVKELQINNGKALLIPRSTDPRFQEPLEITWPANGPQEIGVDTVEITGVVIGMYRNED